jgi:hypothetical protein
MYYRKIKSGRWLFEIQKIGYPRLSKSFKDLRIGGVCKKQIPILTVGNRATVWIIRNHDDYKDLNGADLARKYVPFFDERR